MEEEVIREQNIISIAESLHKELRSIKYSSEIRVRELITAHPVILEHRDRSGKLAVHIAIEFQCRAEVVKLLINGFPDSVRIADDEGSLLIHKAMFSSRISSDIVTYLSDLYPEGLLSRNRAGDLPIHVAFYQYNRSKISALCLIGRRCPSSLHEFDKHGYLPLHIACYFEEYQLITNFLAIHPLAVQVKTLAGDLPIHIACRGALLEAMICLAETYPESLSMKDSKGIIPLQVVILNGMDDRLKAKVIRRFIFIRPGCVDNQVLDSVIDMSRVMYEWVLRCVSMPMCDLESVHRNNIRELFWKSRSSSILVACALINTFRST